MGSRMSENFVIICPSLLETHNALSRASFLVVKIAKFLSTTETIASDFSPVIILKIHYTSKIALLDSNFGRRFLGFYLTKILHFWNLSSGYGYISNKRFYKHDHILTLSQF